MTSEICPEELDDYSTESVNCKGVSMMNTRVAGLILGLGLGVGLVWGGLPGLNAPIAQAQTDDMGLLTAEPGSRINVRTGPGTGYPAQHYGLSGDRVTILTSAAESCGRVADCPQWYRVRFLQSGAVGWVRGDFLIRGTAPLAEGCHRQLAAERSRINTVNNSFLSTFFFDPSPLSPYRDRPYELTVMLGGEGQATVLSSPQFMRNISDRLIQNCGSVSAVRFTSNNSGWHDVYGLINGMVTGFTCVDIDPAREPRWGEYYCGI